MPAPIITTFAFEGSFDIFFLLNESLTKEENIESFFFTNNKYI
jgi:hypothetical protein